MMTCVQFCGSNLQLLRQPGINSIDRNFTIFILIAMPQCSSFIAPITITMKKTFFCIDAHTCGNPVRLVAGGGPALDGATMSEKRQDFLRRYDWIRKGLMFEPRGHDMMSGSILYPPHDPANDVAVLFIETSGCLPMCGHGTIGTITIAVEEGLIVPKTPGVIRMEAPAGLVQISYRQEGNKVKSVKLTNVPAYLAATELTVECPELGELVVDVSYGGNFYAIVDVQQNFPGLEHYSADKLIAWARVLRQRINEKYEFVHPENPTINGCSHILWTGAVLNPASTARNAVFYGDKAIDRSPCGTGTSARMAQWYTKGKLKKGDQFIHESIIGSTFIGTIEEETTVAGKPAIRPGIEGWARIYGYNTISIDPEDDPYAYGFQVI
jgi:4-hydroxyproline epimerase